MTLFGMQPLPPLQAPMKRIFVSIANYRDNETPHTVRDLYAKASHPQRIFAGVLSQVVPEEDADCLPDTGFPAAQVRHKQVHATESQGACWARHTIQQELMEDEEYFLQIDSHSRFTPGWDERFIAMLENCASPRPVLTTYPAGYTPPNNLLMPFTPVLAPLEFNASGVLLLRGHVAFELDFPPQPLPSAFLSANCLFGPAQAFRDVPYDPYLYFHGEEVSLGARLWTHGWDLFAPNDVVLYTDYSTDRARPRHWSDQTRWHELNNLSFRRWRHIFGQEHSTDPLVLREIDRYGLGQTRTLAEYERFADVNFLDQTIGQRAMNAHFG